MCTLLLLVTTKCSADKYATHTRDINGEKNAHVYDKNNGNKINYDEIYRRKGKDIENVSQARTTELYSGFKEDEVTEGISSESNSNRSRTALEASEESSEGKTLEPSDDNEQQLTFIRPQDCILARSQFYLSWWVHENGSLRIPENVQLNTSGILDLSLYFSTEDAIFNHVLSFASENPSDVSNKNLTSLAKKFYRFIRDYSFYKKVESFSLF